MKGLHGFVQVALVVSVLVDEDGRDNVNYLVRVSATRLTHSTNSGLR